MEPPLNLLRSSSYKLPWYAKSKALTFTVITTYIYLIAKMDSILTNIDEVMTIIGELLYFSHGMYIYGGGVPGFSI